MWSKISAAASNAAKALKSSGPKFSEIIPPSSILSVPLDEVALIILNGIKATSRNATISRHMAISTWASSYPKPMREQAERRLTEAWQLLERDGLVVEKKVMGTFESWFATEKSAQITHAAALTYGRDDLLPDGLLMAAIKEKVKPLYAAGRLDDACAAAYKQLEISVRTLCGFDDSVVGKELMRQAFKPHVGPLADLEAPEAEQIAARELFEGAIGFYRNSFAHREIGLRIPAQAASIILVANELIAVATILHNARQEQNQRGAAKPAQP